MTCFILLLFFSRIIHYAHFLSLTAAPQPFDYGRISFIYSVQNCVGRQNYLWTLPARRLRWHCIYLPNTLAFSLGCEVTKFLSIKIILYVPLKTFIFDRIKTLRSQQALCEIINKGHKGPSLTLLLWTGQFDCFSELYNISSLDLALDPDQPEN